MDHTRLLDNIFRHIRLDKAETQHFLSLLTPKKYPVRSFALREREICHYSIFVTEGCLRGFTTDKNGFEHVLQFAPPGWWIADLYSLISRKAGALNIQALEETDAWLLSKTAQEQLFTDIPKFERFFRILVENALVSSQQRIVDNLSRTAEERYELFCARYPTLVHCVPQKQIASYIGVTPEFFSKMKARLLRSK